MGALWFTVCSVLFFSVQVPNLMCDELKRTKRHWITPPLSVAENHIGPYPLLVAKIGSDLERTGKVSYSITGEGADQPPVGLFTVDRSTGRLYVTQALDRETKERYKLQVRAVAADGSGSSEDPMDIVIHIIDQNDNKPVFTFFGNVAQSSEIGFEVTKVTATDDDEPNNDNSDLRYQIISQEPQQPSPNMFAINQVTGAIRVNAAGLDRQTYPEYALMIEARDMMGEGLTGLAKLILSVTDINVNAPVASLTCEKGKRRKKRSLLIPSISVAENSRGPFPLYLSQVRSDLEKQNKVFYSISGPGADVGLFTIDRETGGLYVTQALDRETQDQYMLQAHVMEDGGSEASEAVEIIVKVIDQNDNKPVFANDTFVVEVPQSSPKGFLVVKVEATDADEPDSDNSDIGYRIIRQEPEDPNPAMFTIDADTGEIRVQAAELDKEKHPQYTLTVEAADMRGEGLTGTANVVLTVTDRVINAPTK